MYSLPTVVVLVGYDGGLRRENLGDKIDSVPHTSLSTSSTVGLQSVPVVQLPSHKFTRLNPGVVTKDESSSKSKRGTNFCGHYRGS